jgi:hypothetical protein
MSFFDIFKRRIGCYRAFTDDDCEDNYQFWFCGKVDPDDGEIHYCSKCLKRKLKQDALDMEDAE